MVVRVEFTDPKLQNFVMKGPSVDYLIRQGFLIVASNPHTHTPEKKGHIPNS